MIKIGKKFGFVDQVNQRKIHRGAIPRIGGIAISIGTMLPILHLFIIFKLRNIVDIETTNNMLLYFGGGLAISFLGLIDDIKGVNAKIKLLFQTVIAIARTVDAGLVPLESLM